MLSVGFRPFFLGAAIWAGLSMILWIGLLSGSFMLPIALDPVSWHTHEFLFGYLHAVVAGFLLTAVPNWTGRLPVVGVPLAALFALWLAGRMAIFFSGSLPYIAVAIVDLAMPTALVAVIAREIVSGRNWRNLIVMTILTTLLAGNCLFHWQVMSSEFAADGLGLRVGLAAAIVLITVIGGRVVPSFTRNWLAKRNSEALPAPLGRFDQFAIIALVLALAVWIYSPDGKSAGWMLIAAGMLHICRLARWTGLRTLSEPLVFVLHVGYGFVPIGAMATGLAIVRPDMIDQATAKHVWMVGAVGLMTLAIMSRATLGHTNRPLTADFATSSLYALMIASALARFLAGLSPGYEFELTLVAGCCWIACFATFVLFYGPMLLGARLAPAPRSTDAGQD